MNRMFNRFKRLEPEIIEELKNRYLAGEKYVVISAEMGVSTSVIYKYAYRLGLPPRQLHQNYRHRDRDARTQNQESDQQTAEQT